MIRLLYFTDSHIRGSNPRARIDDFPTALKSKLREIWKLAADYQCKAVVCGGDLFDRPDPAYIVAGEFAAVLAECPVPLYTVPGNHEIYGYNLDTVPRTALGLLAQIEVVQLLNRTEPVVLEDEDAGFAVYITGQGYHGDIDRSQADYQASYEIDWMGVYKVHVVHGMLVEKPLPYDVPHTLIKDLKTDADVILTGHEHVGFRHQKCKSGAICVNPGALSRVRADMAEMYRPIQVALLEFSGDSDIRVEMLTLSCVRPGTEVLSREYLTQQAEREERTAHFLSLLASEGETRFLDIREIIDDISRRENLPKSVVQDALNRLSVAREELGRGYQNAY